MDTLKPDEMAVQYWAAKPIEEIAAQIEDKFEEYQKWGSSTGYFDRITSAYDAFYGFDNNGTLRVVRDDDDVAQINVNHYKSLIRRIHILVTENKLAFQPRARNSDSKSQVQSDLARGIAEYYGDEKHMNDTFSQSVLGSLIQLEYYVHAPWDITEGYELRPDGGQIIKSGDQLFEGLGPLDVAKLTSTEKSPWFIIRKKVNKFDEAALHTDFAAEILKSTCESGEYDLTRRGIASESEQFDEDMTYKYILYHARTPAMPDGRRTEIIAGQVLSDSGLGKYRRVPLFRISAGDVLGTGFGDSPAIDLLPLQQAISALYSGTVTNNLNNALQMIWSPDPNLTTRKLGNGQILVTSSAEPKALNLTGSAEENYKMIDLLKGDQQLLSGVNDVARGNPGAQLKSGTSLAVILAQAIQYVNDLQKSYAMLASDVSSCLINNIQAFATEEMTAYIVGASRKGQIKKFKAPDIIDIERFTVDLGNPLTQSYAGRNEMITAWQQYGIVKSPKQIINFLRTGEIDSITEDPFSDSLLIRDENEQLRKGIAPIVLLTDNHAEHIIEHKAIMSSPEAREDPKVVEAWRLHVQEHIATMREVPPDLAAILSGQPLPPVQGMADSTGQTQPTIDGARMPSLPAGTPPSTQASYQQVLDAVPPDDMTAA